MALPVKLTPLSGRGHPKGPSLPPSFRVRIPHVDLLMVGGTTGNDPLERAIERLEEQRIDALIVMSLLFSNLPPAMLKADFPGVFIEDHQTSAPRVTFDAEPGLSAALTHLHELGHRSILWLSNQPSEAQQFISPRISSAKKNASSLKMKMRTCLFNPRADHQSMISHYSAALLGATDVPATVPQFSAKMIS